MLQRNDYSTDKGLEKGIKYMIQINHVEQDVSKQPDSDCKLSYLYQWLWCSQSCSVEFILIFWLEYFFCSSISSMRSFGHVVISVAIEFPLSSKGDALFLMLVGMVFVIICRVWIKHITLFVNYWNAKEISFIQSQQYKTLCKTQEKHMWIPFILLGSYL